MLKRRQTVEIKSIVDRTDRRASPPPAPSGASLREWFAGLALGNPELMRGVDPQTRLNEAVKIADELISALAVPKMPDVKKLEQHIDNEMKKLVDELTITEEENFERKSPTSSRPTVPEFKMGRFRHEMPVSIEVSGSIVNVGSMLPSPATPMRPGKDAGRYTILPIERSDVMRRSK